MRAVAEPVLHEPRGRRVRQALIGRGELLAAARVLGDVGARSRSISMLSGWWISPSVLTGLSSPSIRIDSDVDDRRVGRSRTIFQMRPLVELNGLPPAAPCRAAAGVDDVDDVRHAGSLVVGHVLDAHELEDVVQVAPVLEDPLRAVDAGAAGDRRAGAARCRRSGGGGYGPPSVGRDVRGHHVGAVRVLARRDLLRDRDEVAADARSSSRRSGSRSSR